METQTTITITAHPSPQNGGPCYSPQPQTRSRHFTAPFINTVLSLSNIKKEENDTTPSNLTNGRKKRW